MNSPIHVSLSVRNDYVTIAPNLKFRKKEMRKLLCVMKPVPKQVLFPKSTHY